MTTPTDGTKLSRTTALTIDTAPSSTTLASKWAQVVSFYDAKSNNDFYIAVKNVNATDTISSLSNGVKVRF